MDLPSTANLAIVAAMAGTVINATLPPRCEEVNRRWIDVVRLCPVEVCVRARALHEQALLQSHSANSPEMSKSAKMTTTITIRARSFLVP